MLDNFCVRETDILWRPGRTVHLSIDDDVPDPDGVLSVTAYALMFVRDERSLAEVLEDELRPFGLDVEVREGPARSHDPSAIRILVRIGRAPFHGASWLERRRAAEISRSA